MLVRKTPPTDALVSLDEIKKHLRVDFEDDDSLIQSLLDAAMSHLDGPRGVLGRCIQEQVWTWTVADLQQPLRLPIPYVTACSAERVEGGAPVHLTPNDCGIWTVVSAAGVGSGAVAIDITASTPTDAHPAIAAAVMLLVGHWYANREAVVTGTIATTLPLAVDRLLAPLKLNWI